MLEQSQLDEGAIDAEAFRLAFSDVLQVDGMLTSKEAQFSKTLRQIAEYRKKFALQIQSSVDQMLARNDVPEPANDKSAA